MSDQEQRMAGEGNTTVDWESEIEGLLDELIDTQKSMIEVLQRKRKSMLDRDVEAIEALQPHEESLCQRLFGCQATRSNLLETAKNQGLQASDVQQLAKSVVTVKSVEIDTKIKAAKNQTQQLRHYSLSNWIIAQRNLLHVSQLLEIIATGGQKGSTYGDGKSSTPNGFVLDQEA